MNAPMVFSCRHDQLHSKHCIDAYIKHWTFPVQHVVIVKRMDCIAVSEIFPYTTVLSSLLGWEEAKVKCLQVWSNSTHPRSPWPPKWAVPVLLKDEVPPTRYRALGQGLIPVNRQSARRWLFESPPALGCHYFPQGLRSPQPKNVTVLWQVPSYTASRQRHIGVNNLPKVDMQVCRGGN